MKDAGKWRSFHKRHLSSFTHKCILHNLCYAFNHTISAAEGVCVYIYSIFFPKKAINQNFATRKAHSRNLHDHASLQVSAYSAQLSLFQQVMGKSKQIYRTLNPVHLPITNLGVLWDFAIVSSLVSGFLHGPSWKWNQDEATRLQFPAIFSKMPCRYALLPHILRWLAPETLGRSAAAYP